MKYIYILIIILILIFSQSVFVKSQDMTLDISKLELIYKHTVDSEHYGTVSAINKSKIYSLDGHIYRSDNFSLFDVSLNIYNPKLALSSQGFIIYIQNGGIITYYDLIQEKIKWTFEADDICVNACLVNNTKIFFQGQRSSLLIDLNGKTVWKTNGWKEETQHLFCLQSRICFVSNKKIYGVSIENGKIIFNKDFNYSIKSLFANNDYVFLLLTSGKMLYYFDKDLNYKGSLLNQKDQYIHDCYSINKNIYVCDSNNRILSIDTATLKNKLIFDYFKSKYSFEHFEYLSITFYYNYLVVFSENYIDFINLKNNTLTKRLTNEFSKMIEGSTWYVKPNIVFGDNKILFQVDRNIICFTDIKHKPPRGYGDYEPKTVDLGLFEFIKSYGNYGYFTNNSEYVNIIRLMHKGLPDTVNYLLKTPNECNLKIKPLKEDGQNNNKVSSSLNRGFIDIGIYPDLVSDPDFDYDNIKNGKKHLFSLELYINEKIYSIPVTWTIANSKNYQILLQINNLNVYIHDPRIGKLPRTIKYELKRPPVIIEGITLLPLRFISEILGYKVDWEEATKTIRIKLDNYEIVMTEGKKECYVDKKLYVLPYPPTNIGGSIMVPLRFLADNLALTLTWIKETQTILLEKTNYEISKIFTFLDEYNQNSLQPIKKYNNYFEILAKDQENDNMWILLFDDISFAKTVKKNTTKRIKGEIQYNIPYDLSGYGTDTYPSILVKEISD